VETVLALGVCAVVPVIIGLCAADFLFGAGRLEIPTPPGDAEGVAVAVSCSCGFRWSGIWELLRLVLP